MIGLLITLTLIALLVCIVCVFIFGLAVLANIVPIIIEVWITCLAIQWIVYVLRKK